jgi:hypothetical protein
VSKAGAYPNRAFSTFYGDNSQYGTNSTTTQARFKKINTDFRILGNLEIFV